MSSCNHCGIDYGTNSFSYCLHCGTQMVPTSDLPTLETKVPQLENQQTVILQNVRSENTKLKSQITELKKNIESVFGGTEEPVEKRLERIFKISGFERNSNRGWVLRAEDPEDPKTDYYNSYIPISEGSFLLYQSGEAGEEEDPVFMYIATYTRTVDFEKELADIRVLLAACFVADVACSFVIVTNEDLSKKKSLLNEVFNQMKTALPRNERKYYDLEIWDKDGLLENEHELKIKINPATPTSKRPKLSKP